VQRFPGPTNISDNFTSDLAFAWLAAALEF